MKPGDRLFCLFVEPLYEGDTFTSWPLHVTIVPWFRLGDGSREIAENVSTLLQPIQLFTVIMGEEHIKFGHQRGKYATLVSLPSPVTEIEQRIRQYLKSLKAWMVDETTSVKREYKPHVTEQGLIRMSKSESFMVDKMYLICQYGGHKTVDAIVHMQG